MISLVVLYCFWLADIFFKYMPYFLRTLEPSVPTINYELRLVLEKEIVPIKLKIEIIICKPANMRYVLMFKK